MASYERTKFLAHHGILGQKWGIRRFQNPDGTFTSAGKERYLKKGTHGTFQGQSRDNDIVIRKGTTAYRAQQNPTSKHVDGHTYVTFDPAGHMEYLYATMTTGGDNMGLFDSGVFDSESKKPLGYSVQLKLTKDLIMPSYEKSMDAFFKSVNDIGLKTVAEKVQTNDYSYKDFIKDMKNLTLEEARDRAYINFIRKVTVDEDLKRSFFNDLKVQGYNAIVDENDNHFDKYLGGSFSLAPVIIFDKKGTLLQTKLTEIDRQKSEDINRFVGNGSHEFLDQPVDRMYKYWETGDKKYLGYTVY